MSPIEIETGPMFSGKTEEMIRRIKRLRWGRKEQGKDYLVFNHATDTRYGENVIASHGTSEKIPAIALQNSQELLNLLVYKEGENYHLKPDFFNLDSLFLDEAQFFDDALPDVLDYLDQLYLLSRDKPIKIIVAGLDKDFRGKPYGCMPKLLSYAHKVNKFPGICNVCGEDADYTQRIVNGEIPSYHDPINIVGAQELYESRCRSHHEIKDAPKP